MSKDALAVVDAELRVYGVGHADADSRQHAGGGHHDR